MGKKNIVDWLQNKIYNTFVFGEAIKKSDWIYLL